VIGNLAAEETLDARIYHMKLAPIAALVLVVATAAPLLAAPAAVPFIENNYPKALAEARSRHVPIFVESWAGW